VYQIPCIPSVAALALLVAMFAPATASAQIYAWRDANGTLVLSDRELNTPTKIFEVPGAPSYRTTTADDRAVSAPRFDDLVSRTRSGTRCVRSWCARSSRWSPASTRWRRRPRARWA
jgi:hypothetical protein